MRSQKPKWQWKFVYSTKILQPPDCKVAYSLVSEIISQGTFYAYNRDEAWRKAMEAQVEEYPKPRIIWGDISEIKNGYFLECFLPTNYNKNRHHYKLVFTRCLFLPDFTF